MIKFVPFFILFFIICFLATPTNSLAPDVHTVTINNDNQSFLNKVFSFLREEDLFWWRGNKFVY